MQFQFNQIKARTREERAAAKDKELIEKARLQERQGGFYQYTEHQGLVSKDAPYFCSEAERFDKDFAVYDRKKREEEFTRKQLLQQQKRERMIERDLQRWTQMDQEEEKKQQKEQEMRQKYSKGVKNFAQAAYNPITLEYDPTEQGEILRHADEKVKYRAAMRRVNLDSKQNSNYNILTGETRMGPPVPKPPLGHQNHPPQ